MTRDEAITEIRRHLGFNRNIDSAVIISAMKRVQLLLEKRVETPWFLQSEMSDISTTAGEERVPLPSDFLGEVEEEVLYLYDSSEDIPWIPLDKGRSDELRHLSVAARPQCYSIAGKYFRLFPTPDDAYELKMIYYKKAEVLDSNIENEWLEEIPDLIIGGAGALVAASARNAPAKEAFEQIATLANSILEGKIEERKHVQRRYVMGGEN